MRTRTKMQQKKKSPSNSFLVYKTFPGSGLKKTKRQGHSLKALWCFAFTNLHFVQTQKKMENIHSSWHQIACGSLFQTVFAKKNILQDPFPLQLSVEKVSRCILDIFRFDFFHLFFFNLFSFSFVQQRFFRFLDVFVFLFFIFNLDLKHFKRRSFHGTFQLSSSKTQTTTGEKGREQRQIHPDADRGSGEIQTLKHFPERETYLRP